MKTLIVICLITVLTICGVKDSVFSMNPPEEITYPPKPKLTEFKDVNNAFDSLKASVKDLAGAVVGDIKKQGINKSVHDHSKFYGSIFIFGVLTLIWLKNRTH